MNKWRHADLDLMSKFHAALKTISYYLAQIIPCFGIRFSFFLSTGLEVMFECIRCSYYLVNGHPRLQGKVLIDFESLQRNFLALDFAWLVAKQTGAKHQNIFKRVHSVRLHEEHCTLCGNEN